MADKAKNRREVRARRKAGLRKRVRGTSEKPRLCIYRSLKFTYAQLINDEDGIVLGAASTREVVADSSSAKCKDSAKTLGMKIAEIAKAKNIENIVFDRNGFIYHGRVAAVADGAREGGLKF